MANKHYSDANPNYVDEKEKKMGPGMKNEDGRQKGSEYNDAKKASADFEKVVYPNEKGVNSLGHQKGAE